MAECICPKGTWYCIDGTIYGPCSYEECDGACEDDGDCDCKVCHG